MSRTSLLRFAMVVLGVVIPSRALAQEQREPQQEPPQEPPKPQPQPQPHVVEGPPPPPIEEKLEPGPGVAVGYENGLWGANFAQGLRLRVPFTPRFGLMVKAVLAHPTSHEHNMMAHYGGGRLELWGASRPLADLFRVYGGGGLVVTTKVLGMAVDKEVHWGLGGHFGLEVFMTRHAAFFIEIGGSTNADGTVAGATAMAGLQWYFGR